MPLFTEVPRIGILGSSSGYEGKKKAGASSEAPAYCSGATLLALRSFPLRVLREGLLLGSHADQS